MRNPSGPNCAADVQIGNQFAQAPGAATAIFATPITITFFDVTGVDEWTKIQEPGKFSYKSTLAHEMMHAFGLDHSGSWRWSADGQRPTMTSALLAGEGSLLATLEQDDAGGAAWLRNDGYHRFWSANPGFEDNDEYWVTDSISSPGASYAETGASGLRVQSDIGWAYIDSTYDPWLDPGLGVVPGMSDQPTIWFFARIRSPLTPNSGALKIREKHRDFKFLAAITKYGSNPSDDWTMNWTAIPRSGAVRRPRRRHPVQPLLTTTCVSSSRAGPTGTRQLGYDSGL